MTDSESPIWLGSAESFPRVVVAEVGLYIGAALGSPVQAATSSDSYCHRVGVLESQRLKGELGNDLSGSSFGFDTWLPPGSRALTETCPGHGSVTRR